MWWALERDENWFKDMCGTTRTALATFIVGKKTFICREERLKNFVSSISRKTEYTFSNVYSSEKASRCLKPSQ